MASGWNEDDDVEMIYDYNGERIQPTNKNKNNSRSRSNGQPEQFQNNNSNHNHPGMPPAKPMTQVSSNIDSSAGTTTRFSQVDLDNVFDPFAAAQEDEELKDFFDEDDNQKHDLDVDVENPNRVYSDGSGVLNDAVHQIAGSPWAKPAYNPSNRPTDPLPIAKYTSGIALTLTLGLIIFLLFISFWNYTSVGRIIVELILAILSFFGLFWNSYFVVSSIFK